MSENTIQARDGRSPLEVSSFFGPSLHPPVAQLIGGRRGMIDGALPPALFVASNALTGTVLSKPQALAVAITAAGTTALTLGVLRWTQGQPLKQVVRGFVALTVAVLFVVLSGEARSFFLPGMYVDAVYAALFAGSAVVGWPLVGVIYAALFRTGSAWRDDPRPRRVFMVASFAWSALYALRAGAQWVLYREDQPVLMAITKVALGWPLTVAAVGLTLAALRRAVRPASTTR